MFDTHQLLERKKLVDKINRLSAISYQYFSEEELTAHSSRLTASFDALALDVFNYQYKYNAFFSQFCDLIYKNPHQVNSIFQLPFLPITFFKNKTLKTGDWHSETKFLSSGTTGVITSSHHVMSVDWYNSITKKAFEIVYGSLKNYCILGLLPAYLERPGSSLVHMVNYFIKQSEHPKSGFFLYNHSDLKNILEHNAATKTPTILFGVTFALLDFVETYTLNLPELIIIETGGMKGRRREIIRDELHESLRKGFGTQKIHSEYGMTELLSQAYLTDIGLFVPSSTMKVLSRDVTDPFKMFNLVPENKKTPTGALNIIDLANIDTCSFIATDDLGKVHPNGSFEVLGRMDNSDVRGCALLMVNG